MQPFRHVGALACFHFQAGLSCLGFCFADDVNVSCGCAALPFHPLFESRLCDSELQIHLRLPAPNVAKWPEEVFTAKFFQSRTGSVLLWSKHARDKPVDLYSGEVHSTDGKDWSST